MTAVEVQILPKQSLSEDTCLSSLGFSVVGGIDNEHLAGVSSPFVASISPNGEAAAKGMKEGDRIIHINDVDAADLTHDEIVNLLRTGDNITLTVEQNGEERILTESMAAHTVDFPSLVQSSFERTAAYVADVQANNIPSYKEISMDKMDYSDNIIEVTPTSELDLSGKCSHEEPEYHEPRKTSGNGYSNVVYLGFGVAIGAIAVLSCIRGRHFFNANYL